MVAIVRSSSGPIHVEENSLEFASWVRSAEIHSYSLTGYKPVTLHDSIQWATLGDVIQSRGGSDAQGS